jgi:hypothetical protein
MPRKAPGAWDLPPFGLALLQAVERQLQTTAMISEAERCAFHVRLDAAATRVIT